MNVAETCVERRKAFLREFYPERYKTIQNMAIKAVDGTLENFTMTCLETVEFLSKLDQEVFYAWLWQYASIYY